MISSGELSRYPPSCPKSRGAARSAAPPQRGPDRGDIFTEQLEGHFHWTATGKKADLDHPDGTSSD
jgi:hypothetical protein